MTKAKGIEVWATKKDGKINWISQGGKPLTAKGKEFLQSYGNELIRVRVTEITPARKGKK